VNKIEAAIVVRDWLSEKGVQVSNALISPTDGSASLFPYFSLNNDDGYISIVKNYICLVFPPHWLRQYFLWSEGKYNQFVHEASLKTIDSDDKTRTLLEEINTEIEQLLPRWCSRSADADSPKITIVLEHLE
jgi:hypothetical protein